MSVFPFPDMFFVPYLMVPYSQAAANQAAATTKKAGKKGKAAKFQRCVHLIYQSIRFLPSTTRPQASSCSLRDDITAAEHASLVNYLYCT
jgi:hypothetical protein